MKLITPANMCLRPVEEGDHKWLIELHNDPEVLRNLTNPNEIEPRDHYAWWAGIRNDPREHRLVFQVDGERAGFTKFYAVDRSNDSCVLGADMHRDFRGKGLAKHMWNLMLQRCFGELALHRVSLTTAEYNTIGRRVYMHIGFLPEGRLVQSLKRDGAYHDQLCMYMLKEDWECVEHV